MFTINSPSVSNMIKTLERKNFEIAYSYTLFGDDPKITVSFGCVLCNYTFNTSIAKVYKTYSWGRVVESKPVMTPDNFLSLCKLMREVEDEA